MSDLDVLRGLVARYSAAQPDAVDADSVLADLPGWGSLPGLQLLAAVEQHYGIAFEVRAFLEIATVGGVLQAIAAQAGRAPVLADER